MTVPFYRVAKASPAVLALLGDPEPRIYPWGENDDAERAYPYVTYRTDLLPDNVLAGRACADEGQLSIDIWAESAQSAKAVRDALRNAIELNCYINTIRDMGRDPSTRTYRISMDMSWWVRRT